MTNKKWCDICEKEVKRKTIKINRIGYSIYVCDRHNNVRLAHEKGFNTIDD